MKLCRTCFDLCEEANCFLLEGDLKNMLKFCVPELDLNINSMPLVLCQICHSTLINLNEFKTKCINTQKKMEVFYMNITTLGDQAQRFKFGVDTALQNVKKVAPFELKLKGKLSENFKKVDISNIVDKVPKRRHSEISKMSTDFKPINEEEDDFLNLLDNSDNVNNPKKQKINLKDFRKHKNTNKSLEETHKCSICKKFFSSHRGLITHMNNSNDHKNLVKKNMVQESKNQKTEGKNPELKLQKDVSNKSIHYFKCKKCHFASKYKIGLNRHLAVCPKLKSNTHLGRYNNKKKLLICTICEKVFTDKKNLESHKKTEHNILTTEAVSPTKEVHNSENVCEEKNISKQKGDELKTLTTFHCNFPDCGKLFTTNKGLLIHRAHHIKENGPYEKCCNMTFSNKKSYKLHLLDHKSKENKQCLPEKKEDQEKEKEPEKQEEQEKDTLEYMQSTAFIPSEETTENPICKVNSVGTVTISDEEELEENGFAGFPVSFTEEKASIIDEPESLLPQTN